MLIIGAGGLAKEILEIALQKEIEKKISFYDDINIQTHLFNKFNIIKEIDIAKLFFEQNSNDFTVGIGGPLKRRDMQIKFSKIGGNIVSTISEKANIGKYNIKIGPGCNIMHGVNISNDVTIGFCNLIYYNSNITHDCVIGDFVEISPSVNILGKVKVGSFTSIGTNTTILPNIIIGENVVIGAGSVVTKDIPSNTKVFGIPAIKH
jgi:sugar O-acyltransferase (sialic acid O-acetyltransferase NeuD family)